MSAETGSGDRKTGSSQSVTREQMKSGNEYAFSVESSVVDPGDVGFTNGLNGYNYKVITGFNLAGNDATLILAEVTAPSGVTTEQLFAARTDASGNAQILPGGKSVVIPKTGETLVLGRHDANPADLPAGQYKVDLEGIFTGELEAQRGALANVSRNHLLVRRDSDGSIRAEASGLNSTEYWRPKSGLIERSDVPVQDTLRVAASLAVTQAESASAAPTGESVADTREEQLMARLEELKSGLSEDDSLNLFRYASGLLNKREAQRRAAKTGAQYHGQDSIFQEQQAGQALRALSAEARSRADEYLRTFSELDRIRK